MLDSAFADKPPIAALPRKPASWLKRSCVALLGASMLMPTSVPFSTPASAQQPAQKPNILFIMGDDIGWMQPGIYHRGLMVGETPNIDRIGQEGAIFMDYIAMQSCTSGAQCLLHRHVSGAHGHDSATTARQPGEVWGCRIGALTGWSSFVTTSAPMSSS